MAAAETEPPRYLDRIIEREGIRMQVRMEALESDAPVLPQTGQFVRLWLEGKRLADDQPISNWRVGAWLDRETDTLSGAVPVCRQRIARYLSGNLLQRPLLDLTGYYVLSLDAEPSVSVLDPSVSFSGRSSLYGAMQLAGTGFDWQKTSDDARLFVALPNEKKLAIADLHTLQVLDHLDLPGQPTRLALQPDERLLWVGLTGEDVKENAVEIIDTVHDRAVARIPLAVGHHEFAFSSDGRHAFVSSRQGGRLTIIDAGNLQVRHERQLGFEPISLVFVDQSSLLWVIDARAGHIHRFDVQGRPVDRIALAPGLGPAKLSADGRHILIVNPGQHWLHVLDAMTGAEKHRLTVSGQPYDVLFSRQFAYIRSLQSEQVGLLSLASLDTSQPILKFVPAGATAVAATPNLPRASSMALTLDQAGAFFTTPAERTLHHYMEGMNAPSAGLRAYGHTPLAVMTVQRGMRETSPGQYSAVIRLPSSGRMILALASETPVLRECLGLNITQPVTTRTDAISAQWVSARIQRVRAGDPIHFRVRIVDAVGMKQPAALRLRIMQAQGGSAILRSLQADPDKPGEWVADLTLTEPGAYYVHLEGSGSQSLQSVFATVFVETQKTRN